VWIHRSRLWALALGIALTALSGCVFAGGSVGDLPLNAQLTSQAWAALDVKAYQRAIVLADSCISKFGGSADLQQEALRESGAPVPPTGKVSAEQKADIFSRGLLNDVATCYFIKAEALVALGRTREALQAYEQTRSYTHARCWDPQGWFWSPASAAEGKLRHLPVPPESSSSQSPEPANSYEATRRQEIK
jgi:hypothetical protein